MKAFVITLFNDKYSVQSAENTLKTARQMNDDLHIEMVRAVTPVSYTHLTLPTIYSV